MQAVELTAALSGAVVALGGALLLLWKLSQLMRRAARKLDALDHVVQRELTPNGGGSMKDKSTATANTLATVSDRLTKVETELAEHLRLSALIISGKLTLPLNPPGENEGKHQR